MKMNTPAGSNGIHKRETRVFARLLAASVILLITVQAAAAVRIACEVPVNTEALAAAAKAFYENSFVPKAPVMSCWALIGRIFLRQPLILIFSVAPVIMIPGYYCIYMLLAGKLIDRPEDKWFMLLIICLLNLWGYQSEYLVPYTLLYSWYTGSAIVVHCLLPFTAYLLADRCRIGVKKAKTPDEAAEGYTDDYYEQEEEDMKNHKIINARNLAVALLIVVVMLLGSVYIMNRKINSLYETTVNLQQEIEELKNSGR